MEVVGRKDYGSYSDKCSYLSCNRPTYLFNTLSNPMVCPHHINGIMINNYNYNNKDPFLRTGYIRLEIPTSPPSKFHSVSWFLLLVSQIVLSVNSFFKRFSEGQCEQ